MDSALGAVSWLFRKALVDGYRDVHEFASGRPPGC